MNVDTMQWWSNRWFPYNVQSTADSDKQNKLEILILKSYHPQLNDRNSLYNMDRNCTQYNYWIAMDLIGHLIQKCAAQHEYDRK
jgi:hypothetical protein